MKNRFSGILVTVCLICLAPFSAMAQETEDWIRDSTAMYDSLLTELMMLGLLEKPYQSFFDVNAGLGNGAYALQSKNGATASNTLLYNAGAGYYHKSGFSVSGGVNMGNDGVKTGIMQGFVSPAFDVYGDKVRAGINFFRYFNNPETEMYLSPLVNEFYGYFEYKKWYLQPKLAVDYGWGTMEGLETITRLDTVRQNRRNVVVRRISEEIKTVSFPWDLSFIFTLKHDYYPHLGKKRMLYTPAISVVAGTGRYGTNLAVNSIGNRLFNNGQNGSKLLQTSSDRSSSGNNASSNSSFPDEQNKIQLSNLNQSQNIQATFGKA